MTEKVGIDFETYLISDEQPIPKPVCLSEYSIGGTPKLHIGYTEMDKALRRILCSNAEIIAHNAKFELLVIWEHFPHLRNKILQSLDKGKWFCTKLYEHLLENVSRGLQPKKDLAILVKKYFQEDISAGKKDPDAWRLRYNELDGVPREEWPQEAIDYAIDDSIWALKIREAQYKVNDNITHFEQVYDEFCLSLMASSGIEVDKERIAQLEQECWEHIIPSYRLLNQQGMIVVKSQFKDNGEKYSTPPVTFKKGILNQEEICIKQDSILENWKDNNSKYKLGKSKKAILKYIEKEIPVLIKTEKGHTSTTSEALSQYLSQKPDDKVIKALDTITDYEKTLTAFVSRLKESSGVIRTEYNAIVSSGRTSSRTTSAYPSVNIQQIPRGLEGVTWDVRNCFVPRKGFIWVSIDYNGLELASTAHQLGKLFNHAKMLKTINSGDEPVDMHSKLAARIKSMKDKRVITYEEFVSRKKEKGFKEYRQLSKPINLGFPGGIGYDTMRTLLAKEGIFPKFKVIQTSKWEDDIKKYYEKFKRDYPVRIKRIGKFEWALVYDELVELKQELFGLYPDLKKFLTDYHENFLTGQTKAVKNEFGEWESEEMYSFNIDGVKRDWCTYTAFCNGYMMQSPSAIGAKRAVRACVKKYIDDPNVNVLSFIHDEINFEVRADANIERYIKEMSEIMIDQMHSVLDSVRIAVEAQTMTYWAKDGNMDTWTAWKNPGSNELRFRKDS